MKIVQYIPPHGEQRIVNIQILSELDSQAAEMQAVGWIFDLERLSTGEFSVTCCNDTGPLVMIVDYRHFTGVVEDVIKDAYLKWQKMGCISAASWDYNSQFGGEDDGGAF